MQPRSKPDWPYVMEALSSQRQPDLELLQLRLKCDESVEQSDSEGISVEDKQNQLQIYLQGIQIHDKVRVQVRLDAQ